MLTGLPPAIWSLIPTQGVQLEVWLYAQHLTVIVPLSPSVLITLRW